MNSLSSRRRRARSVPHAFSVSMTVRRIEQREQQVLDGDELVPLFARSLERVVQTVFKLAG